MPKPRDYAKEYRDYHGKPEQIKRRGQRNKSRKVVEKRVGKAAIKGKDVDHKDHNTANMSRKNLRVRSVSANRADNTHKK